MVEPIPVDFHVHLDLYTDMDKAYAHCASRKAITLAVTTTPRAYMRNVEFAEKAENIHVALGMHPQLIDGDDGELRRFESFAGQARFIGEVGLDAGRKHYHSFAEQERIFERTMRLCHEQGGKVLTIHSVRCATKVLAILERTRVFETCQIVLHWFSASKSEIRRANSMGCLFSVNEAHVRSHAGQRLVTSVPMESLLTETDGPFLLREDAVVQPSDVGAAVRSLGELIGMSPKHTAILVEQNARRILAQAYRGTRFEMPTLSKNEEAR